jgi:hypothetical protein
MSGLEWFRVFFTNDMVQLVVQCTNDYVTAALPAREKPPYYSGETWPPKWTLSWTDVTASELFLFIACVQVMSLVKMPRMDDYWKQKWPFQSLLGRIMSRDRFQAIRSALHFVIDAEKPEGAGALWKVGRFLDLFREACQRVSYPGVNVALDEEMVKCMSQWAGHLTQRVKNKPIDFGIVIRSIVDSVTGYLFSFSVITPGMKVEQTAIDLVRQLPRSYHVVHMDNSIPCFGSRSRSMETARGARITAYRTS